MEQPYKKAEYDPKAQKNAFNSQSSPFKSEKKPENAAKTTPEAIKMEELTDLLKRTQADFENYKKRAEKEKNAAFELGQAKALQALLSVWEAIWHGLEHAKGEQKKAFEPLYNQVSGAFEKLGVKPMQVIGKPFDPLLHECLLTEHNPQKEDGIVLEELQKGFWFNEHVLRTAKVKVNRLEENRVSI